MTNPPCFEESIIPRLNNRLQNGWFYKVRGAQILLNDPRSLLFEKNGTGQGGPEKK